MNMSVSVVLSAVVAATGAATYATQGAPGGQGTLVLQRATIIDGITSEVRRDMTVVIRDGRLESVSDTAAVAHRDATVIDLQHRWLLPGLVDAHVHLRDLASARAALRKGVTTARSLGVDHFATSASANCIGPAHRTFRPSAAATTSGGVSLTRSFSSSLTIAR